MRRNLDAIALFCIVLFLLALENVSSHAGAFARTAAFHSSWCPRQTMRVDMPPMPRVELPDLPPPGR